MKYKTVLIKLFLLLALALVQACVGTVQDAALNENALSDEQKSVLTFSGLEQGRAISHDKIELEFTPLGLSDPNIKYFLYINGSQSPIELSPESLDDSIGGRKRYLLSALQINTQYKFQLKVRNMLTNAESVKEKVLVIKTFDNKTADFKGVTSVSKVAGLSSTTIKVEWVAAKMDGVIVAKEYDPVYYEVTVIGAGGPQNLNNPNYSGSDRKVVKVPDPLSAQITPMNHSNYTSTVIDSLTPNTTHYVQVRAVNKLYYSYLIDPDVSVIPVSRELNTKFLKIKTDAPDGNFDMNRDSLKITNALGVDAFTKATAFWSPGQGTFTGYRLFLRKYSNGLASEATVLATDLLDTTTMDNVSGGLTTPSDVNGRFVNLTTEKTSTTISSLATYEWYQFKLILCKTINCITNPADSNASIVSELRAVRIQPSLAPFDGITRIDNPRDFATADEIRVNYDPPSVTTGYADKLEVYCVDPTSLGSTPASYVYDPVPLDIVPRAGSPVGRCNGLYLTSEPLLGSKFLTVKGVKSIPSEPISDNATYCLAIFPAIRYQAEQIPAAGTYPVEDWVVRCTTPEIRTPSLNQFPGLNGTCSPIHNTLALTWAAPTGGVYTDYKLFYRTIEGSQTFKFSDAVAGNAAYTVVDIPDGQTSLTIPDLRPGTRYRVGLLTHVQIGATHLYSEYNTNVKDCVTPMPDATFNEWSRVFAIGPKVDGRFPHNISGGDRLVRDEAKILEAINVDGIPYEVPLDANGDPINPSFKVPPGHYHASYSPTTYYDEFDGATGTYKLAPIAGSQNGIVSLGWRDVGLNFLSNEFTECQRHPTDPAITTNPDCTAIPTKSNRKYGYKVFRSDDNRLTWKDVTGASGGTGMSLVYARNYNYRKRPNQAPTTERMAFFTDYSVKAMFTDPEGKERGRVLWYKIVPYFEKRALNVVGSGLITPNIIRVVLPPPGMALLKREMANRSACTDIGRDASIDKNNGGYYSCAFNGVGSRPKGVPWSMTNLVLDLGGDMLIDRFELGCQFTRGDYATVPENSLSYFTRLGHDEAGAKSDLRLFDGFSTLTNGNNKPDKLVGCTAGQKLGFKAQLDSDGGSLTNPVTPSYTEGLFGDCLGSDAVSTPAGACVSLLYNTSYTYKFPGISDPSAPFDCTVNNPDDPQNASVRYGSEFRRHLTIQSEFGAIFFHRNQTYSYYIDPRGPGHADLIDSTNDYNTDSQCAINLAAIGTDGTIRARWFPVGGLNRVVSGAGNRSIADMKLKDVLNDSVIYDQTAGPTDEYAKPGPSLRQSSRFDDETKISRIMSSNSAKLPPLTGLSMDLAQQFCKGYEVDVGVSPDGSNSNYLPIQQTQSKRLLRRPEFLAAARFPDAASNHVSSLNYSEANIAAIEGAANPGSCVSYNRNSGGSYSRDNKILPNQILRDTSGTGNEKGFYYTGSSAVDHANMNSENCVSMYGLQDAIGNVSEYSSERLFCDYTKDRLYFGEYNAGDPIQVGKDGGFGNTSRSIEIPDAQDEYRYYWKDAPLRIETAPGVFTTYGTTGVNATPNVSWAQINPNSGYCSIVDNAEGNAQRVPPSKKLRYRNASDVFNPLFTNGGLNLNTTMVLLQNAIDQQSVDYMRNGDGYYLNFGFENLAPQFKDGNSLSITDSGITPTSENALGPFFNPIIGLPISCGGDACLETDDNERVTTPFLKTKLGSQTPFIDDYPIGNSQITNTGISDIRYHTNATFFGIDLTTRPFNNETTVIDGVTINLDGSVSVSQTTLENWWVANPAIRSMQEFSALRFGLPRGTQMGFANGGSGDNSKTGRYTASVINAGYYSKTIDNNGFRCGIMIQSE